MILQSFLTCNSNVQQSVAALDEAALLHSFHTTLSFQENSWQLNLLGSALRSQLLRRSFPLDQKKIVTYPEREIVRLLCSKLSLDRLYKHEGDPFSVDSVGRHFDLAVSRYIEKQAKQISAVYGYEDFSCRSFSTAKKHGLATIYELCIPYWKTTNSILRDEVERRPDWACTMSGALDSAAKLEKKTQELVLSDTIICISNFVERSIPADLKAGKNCIVAQFGCPDIEPAPRPRIAKANQPLRVLFVGSMSQRKGLADIFEAIKLLGREDVELVVMGIPLAPLEFYFQKCPGLIYEPPSHRNKVFQVMQSCDVFAFPSLSEGRGLVQLEAMANRMPLITTINATGDDLVQEGVTGFIVPIRSPEIIAERINWFADHRQETAEMGNKAREQVLLWSWANYRKQIADIARHTLGNR